MNKVLLCMLAFLPFFACTNTKQEKKVLPTHQRMPGDPDWLFFEKENTALMQYVDSITAVYPNYEGNHIVQREISKEFGKKLDAFPKLLCGSSFRFSAMSEINGRTCVAFICNETGVDVWCMNYDKNEALKLDKNKIYELTDYTIDHFERNDDDMGSHFLSLGDVYVSSLKVKELAPPPADE